MKKLKELESELDAGYSQLMAFVYALSAFEKVIVACFGEDLLDSFESDIAFFKDMYMNLGIPMCVKPHILFDHVPEFCRRRGAMGYWSEQAGWVFFLVSSSDGSSISFFEISGYRVGRVFHLFFPGR